MTWLHVFNMICFFFTFVQDSRVQQQHTRAVTAATTTFTVIENGGSRFYDHVLKMTTPARFHSQAVTHYTSEK